MASGGLGAGLVRRVEQSGRATIWIALIVAIAGGGRGVTPGLEAGWAPVLSHALAGCAIWLVYSLLAWFVAHRMLGYQEGFLELTRVLGLPAAVLAGLWLNAIPVVRGWVGFSFALHGLAFIALVWALVAALRVSVWRAAAISVGALGIAGLLMVVLGVPSAVGREHVEDAAAMEALSRVSADRSAREEAWRSS